MICRPAVFALLLMPLPVAQCASGQTAPDGQQMVDCRLPPRLVHIGRTTRMVPRVVRTTKVDCDVRGGLDLALKSIPATLAELHALRCGATRCYSSSEVAHAIGRFREQVHMAIPPEAAALALAINEDLDRASQLGEPIPLNPIQPARLRSDSAASGYRSEDVDNTFGGFKMVIQRVLSHPRLTLTLKVSSTPQKARLVIDVGGVKTTEQSGFTEIEFRNIWRGRYAVEAQMPGYKTFKQVFNLVDDDRTHIVCELHKEQEKEQSFCGFEP